MPKKHLESISIPIFTRIPQSSRKIIISTPKFYKICTTNSDKVPNRRRKHWMSRPSWGEEKITKNPSLFVWSPTIRWGLTMVDHYADLKPICDRHYPTFTPICPFSLQRRWNTYQSSAMRSPRLLNPIHKKNCSLFHPFLLLGVAIVPHHSARLANKSTQTSYLFSLQDRKVQWLRFGSY